MAMLIGYRDAAWESYAADVDSMEGYGVTIELGGEKFDAVLIGADREALDGAAVRFIRVRDDEDYSTRDETRIESAVVDRIVVH